VSDLLEAVDKIKNPLGRDVRLTPLPPLLMSGINNSVVIREIFELATWVNISYVMLSETFGIALDTIKSCGKGAQTWMEPKRIRLPSSTGNQFTTWHSGGAWVSQNSGPQQLLSSSRKKRPSLPPSSQRSETSRLLTWTPARPLRGGWGARTSLSSQSTSSSWAAAMRPK
jgi:hypothetical protein